MCYTLLQYLLFHLFEEFTKNINIAGTAVTTQFSLVED